MKIKRKIAAVSLAVGFVGVIAWFVNTRTVAVLQPEGQIAQKQMDLIVFASLLSLIVIIPVFILTIFIAWKYRAGNTKARYTPDWDHNKILETIWWGIPIALIMVLSVITWRSSHELDPAKPLAHDKKPLTIQVVALDWKWLFIYPDQKIATVNYIQFPKETPINFQITSDAPMNSFWIPQLGGQIYAMTGMSTKLHLIANEEGEYNGVSANISGEGFSGMKFVAKSTTEQDFEAWVASVRTAPLSLNSTEYVKLSQPSKNVPPSFYSSVENELFDTILLKFNLPSSENKASEKHDNYSGDRH